MTTATTETEVSVPIHATFDLVDCDTAPEPEGTHLTELVTTAACSGMHASFAASKAEVSLILDTNGRIFVQVAAAKPGDYTENREEAFTFDWTFEGVSDASAA